MRPQIPGVVEQLQHVSGTPDGLHRQGRLSRQRRDRSHARVRRAFSGRAARGPRLAVSAGRHQPRRASRGGAVPRVTGGDRVAAVGRGSAGLDARLAALSPAAPVRARPLHRSKAALVSAEADQRRVRIALRRLRPAGVRPLAVGGLLDAGARGRLFQAARLHTRSARAGHADLSAGPAAVPAVVGGDRGQARRGGTRARLARLGRAQEPAAP